MKRLTYTLMLLGLMLPLFATSQTTTYTIYAPINPYTFCVGSYLEMPALPTFNTTPIAYTWMISSTTNQYSSYEAFQNRVMTSSDNNHWIQLKVIEADSSITYSNKIRIFSRNPSSENTTVTSCDSYTWHGVTYMESTNVPTFDTVNANGCQHTVHLHLTINHSSNATTDVEACDSYNWYGTTYHASINARHVGTNTSNCPDTNNLHLIIHYSNTGGTESANVCDSYTWHGNTYTVSGNYPYSTQTTHECDSVCTLNLTVRHSSFSVDVHTACDNYTWIDGNTYRSSNNTAQYVIYNTQGCDSTVTLSLTVHYSDTLATESADVCDNFIWNDTKYTTSGAYKYHTNTVLGCDSVCTLYLTIRNSTASTDIVTECSQYTWIDGNTYYRDTMGVQYVKQNAVWCDSVITLYLTILDEERPQPRELVVKNLGTSTPQMIIYPRTTMDKEYAYQWYRDNNIIDGAQMQYYRLGDDDKGVHTFSVYVSPVEQKLCGSTSSVQLTAEPSVKTSLAISPNPAKGAFSISLTTDDEQMAEVSIFNAQGICVVTLPAEDNNVKVDSVLSKGAYYVRATTTQGKIYTDKLIVN